MYDMIFDDFSEQVQRFVFCDRVRFIAQSSQSSHLRRFCFLNKKEEKIEFDSSKL